MLNYGVFKEMSEDLIPFVFAFEWKQREYRLVGSKDKCLSMFDMQTDRLSLTRTVPQTSHL